MRIHVQNQADDPAFAISAALFPAGHSISVGETEAAFRAGLREAEALVSNAASVRKWFGDAPHLKLLFCTSAGLDGLAPFDWLPEGVALLNNRGAHGARAHEYAAMALLMLAGQMPQFIAQQREARWEKRHSSVLAGRRLVVVGTGTLGGAAGRAGGLFGMETVGVRTRAEPHPDFGRVVSVEALDAELGAAEFLFLAAPLTPASTGLLSRARLEALPRGAHVVNIGRGRLVDQEALCDLLDSGHLAGAVLDVFTPEPIPAGHRLWTTRHLVITPHVSADDPATYASDSVTLFLRNLDAFERGAALPNRFDTVRGY